MPWTAATAQQRIDNSAAFAGLRMPYKQKILFAQRRRPNGVFHQVRIYLQDAVVHETRQGFPSFEGVIDSAAQESLQVARGGAPTPWPGAIALALVGSARPARPSAVSVRLFCHGDIFPWRRAIRFAERTTPPVYFRPALRESSACSAPSKRPKSVRLCVPSPATHTRHSRLFGDGP